MLPRQSSIDQIEREMLERQDEEPQSLWWLAEIPLSILFEPLDWIFTFRDLLLGDWTALIGFLPLIPASLRHIAGAAEGLGKYGDEFANLLNTVDEFDEALAVPHSPEIGGFNIDDYRGWKLFSDQYGTENVLEIARRNNWSLEEFEQAIREGQFGTDALVAGTNDVRMRVPVEFAGLYDPETMKILDAWQGSTWLTPDYKIARMSTGSTPYVRAGGQERLIFTHFHPLGGEFSPQDIIAAVQANASEFRAFTKDGGWALHLPDLNQIAEPLDIARELRKALDEAGGVMSLKDMLDQLNSYLKLLNTSASPIPIKLTQ